MPIVTQLDCRKVCNFSSFWLRERYLSQQFLHSQLIHNYFGCFLLRHIVNQAEHARVLKFTLIFVLKLNGHLMQKACKGYEHR